MTAFDPLVSTDWLTDHLDAPDVKIIDGSWRMPGDGDAIEHYHQEHIPGASFFDLDTIADRQTDLPHMLPPPQHFEEAVGAMGVSENDIVVVYDEKGIFSAARVWWTFRAMGHRQVAVLNGGLPKWLAEGRPVSAALPTVAAVSYSAALNPGRRKKSDDVRRALCGKGCLVLDARPGPRFIGAAAEPRSGLRTGHMPGAYNIPFPAVMTERGTMHESDELTRVFSEAGVDLSRPIITSCGSGVTAAILSLALDVSGCREHGLYDGSWAEWGDEKNDDAEFPVESGNGKPG